MNQDCSYVVEPAEDCTDINSLQSRIMQHVLYDTESKEYVN